MKKSGKLVFAADCQAQGLPTPKPEHVFHPVRKWRFDFAWRDYRVALEVDGGAFIGGRHTRGAGFAEDIEKQNEAVRLGWYVLRVLPKNLHKHSTYSLLREVLTNRGWRPQAA